MLSPGGYYQYLKIKVVKGKCLPCSQTRRSAPLSGWRSRNTSSAHRRPQACPRAPPGVRPKFTGLREKGGNPCHIRIQLPPFLFCCAEPEASVSDVEDGLASLAGDGAVTVPTTGFVAPSAACLGGTTTSAVTLAAGFTTTFAIGGVMALGAGVHFMVGVSAACGSSSAVPSRSFFSQ